MLKHACLSISWVFTSTIRMYVVHTMYPFPGQCINYLLLSIGSNNRNSNAEYLKLHKRHLMVFRIGINSISRTVHVIHCLTTLRACAWEAAATCEHVSPWINTIVPYLSSEHSLHLHFPCAIRLKCRCIAVGRSRRQAKKSGKEGGAKSWGKSENHRPGRRGFPIARCGNGALDGEAGLTN
jgi:hypothetical protein